MNIKTMEQTAVITSNEVLITDGQSAMDLLATVRYETGCSALLLPKQTISEDFFHLSTGLAGEVLQKFVNYQMKLAIVGDFSAYPSQNLKDFIYESNHGNTVCFLPTESEALEWLCKA